MRNLLLAGTAGLFVAFGAVSAEAVTQNSPYATMAPPDAVDGYVTEPDPVYVVPRSDGMIEGRAAYVDEGPAYVPVQPHYVYPARRYHYEYYRPYAPFPLSVLPWNW